MKKLITIIGFTTGLIAATAQAEPACIATDMTSLMVALSTGFEGKPCPLVFVTKDITVTEKIDVPGDTTIVGFIDGHPFLQPALNFDAKLTVNDCAISLNYNANLSNLLITTKQQVFNAVCINKGNSTIIRCTIDGQFVSDGFVTGIRNSSGNSSILSDNAVNVVQNGIIEGNSTNSVTILVRNRVSTTATGGIGISLAAPPSIMFGNELFGQARLILPTSQESKFSLGTAANLIKLNNMVGSNDDGSDRSNFYAIYNIFPKFLKTCDAPMGYAPYNEDGSCKTYVFGKTETPATCPLNQIKLSNGSCGCPESMKLDATSNLCFQEKIIEKPVDKIVEKIIEKPVEKIVEKPVPDISKNGIQPIVANPASGGSGCSLASEATAASPVLAFLAIITVTGLIAYRTRPQPARARRKKERRHG